MYNLDKIELDDCVLDYDLSWMPALNTGMVAVYRAPDGNKVACLFEDGRVERISHNHFAEPRKDNNSQDYDYE